MTQQPTPAHPAIMEAQIKASNISEDAPLPTPIVTTSRLVIRALHPNDAASAALNANSPAVAKYMSNAFPHPYTLESAETWIAMNLQLPYQTNFGICKASSPDIQIGGIGLTLGADVSSHTAEVGFWVGENYWGKGYTTEALEGFTKWSFESWEGKDGQRLRRLWARVFSGNNASMRCFEKCGYAKEGVFKGHAEKNGEVMDVHLFGLTKADWEARR
ncbi:acyl-CoA N-acyltransferase [Ophiobolus disseminans]|uniref:Acyl-CoA N-acyltransferase n=1 Tax=Ophiobolus disseminans TaxID=1469910 RepID=A0A6A7A378_9PLEO|nr:acyl-CoA N-acyltransferase [Ophiobolus disseminans]